jgi:hypothetical protein
MIRFREALRRADVVGVTSRLANDARRPNERDLLVDLIAAEGAEEAVQKLSPFWRDADVTIRGIRVVAEDEVEVYERITVPRRDLPIQSVTLLRRRDDRFKIVATSDAPDERFRIRVVRDSGAPAIDDVGFSRAWKERFGATAELLMLEDGDGVLSHPDEGWLGTVRGPVPATDQLGLYEDEVGTGATLIEVGVEPSDDLEERRRQLIWTTRVAHVLALGTGGHHLHVPAAERLIALDRLTDPFLNRDPAASELAMAWVRLHSNNAESGPGFAATRGMTHFMAPEVEYALEDWDEPKLAARVAIALATALIQTRTDAQIGTVVRAAGTRCFLTRARRGVRSRHTYGRFGALRIRPSDRSSGTQPRIVS